MDFVRKYLRYWQVSALKGHIVQVQQLYSNYTVKHSTINITIKLGMTALVMQGKGDMFKLKLDSARQITYNLV